MRLPRDYYVCIDGNDCSVDPRVIGRLVDGTVPDTSAGPV
ncbi:Mu transposase domain-containing protein [Brevibacterium yomogidense]